MDKTSIRPGMKFVLLGQEYLIESIDGDVVTITQGNKVFTFGLNALAHMATVDWRNNNALCDEGLL